MNNFADYFQKSVELYTAPFIKSAIAIVAGYFLYILVCRALKKIAAKGFLDYQLRIILGGIVKWIIIVVVILLCLGFFGVSVGTLWAALSGVLALVAVGFIAVWSVLSNILCSILLIIFPPFRIGDEIEIQEPTSNFFVRGKVVGTNMMFTSLETTNPEDEADSTILRVPNNIFFQKYVRCIPGKGTESLQKFVARSQEQD
ncbi:MAG: mechanosensitive ion channel family protein [Acidiferrobacterales bacterium]|nr:mechanosensitive ion channel family protein [Acidiferrobacterales bacterium]